MDTLELIVVSATLLVVLHVAVAAYLYRAVLSGDSPVAFLDPEAGQWVPEATDGVDGSEPSDDSVSCPACGTANDPSYRFCRRCVADLTGRRRAAGGPAADRLGS